MNKRRSLTQIKILSELNNNGPAETIQELSDRICLWRPSVSRSINSLKEQGFVIQKYRWEITKKGKFEILKSIHRVVQLEKQLNELKQAIGIRK